MARTPTEEAHDVTGKTISWNAEVRKIWGVEWNKPDVEYKFSGRTFSRRTQDAGMYETSPDF